MNKIVFAGLIMCALFLAGCQKAQINKEGGSQLSILEAMAIAQNSPCVTDGQLTNRFFYNNVTKTWWIDLDLQKEGCSPACVVIEETKTAEINWRCTGLLEPTTTTLKPMGLEEAIAIAQSSECVAEGSLMQERAFYNDITKTWWIDLNIARKGCSPACVISEATKTAEINWRCTGLLEP